MNKPKDTSHIELGLAEKLRNREYRRAFFRLSTQDDIAEQVHSVRDIRKLKQKELAELCGMKQSAISRIEQADYNSWTLNTLLRVTDALDARLRVIIETAEEVIGQISDLEAPFYSPGNDRTEIGKEGRQRADEYIDLGAKRDRANVLGSGASEL